MKAVTFTLLLFAFSMSAFATLNKRTITLTLEAPNGNRDQTTMYFDLGITPAYNVHEDAAYIFSNITGIPEFYSYTSDKHACSINGCGTLQSATIIDLGYHVSGPGNYTIRATQLNNFDPTSIIKLIDNQTGDTIDLRENFYQGQLDSNDIITNRFQVSVSSQVQYASTNSNCSNSGGTITITPDSSITWDMVQLMDTLNHVVQAFNNVNGTVTFTGLAEGNYHVVYTYNQYTATNYFYVSGNFVQAAIGVPASPIYTNEDVVFSAITTNANQFNWDFGDSTLIVGVSHPTQVFLQPGTYTVTLYTSNSLGCSASAEVTVVVVDAPATGINEATKSEPTMIAVGKVINVNMKGANLSSNAQIQVYNLLGQSVKAIALNTQTTSISLENQANGYYLVSVHNADLANTKRVFIAK